MSRLFHRARGAAALVGLCLAMATGASAKTPTMAEVRAANVALTAEIAAADAAGKAPPRLADPAHAAQFAVAFDIDALQALDQADVKESLAACSDGLKSMLAYLGYGAKRANLTGMSDPKAAALMGENAMTYQDESALAFRFSVACNAHIVTAVNRDLALHKDKALTAAQLAGLATMRGGLVQVYAGSVQTQQEAYRPSNKRIMIDKAVELRQVYAESMDPSGRRQVIATIDQVLGNPAVDAESRTKLALIRAAMTTTACSLICAQ